jgi:hypothetical protein
MNIKYVLIFKNILACEYSKCVERLYSIGGTCEARKGNIGKT